MREGPGDRFQRQTRDFIGAIARGVLQTKGFPAHLCAGVVVHDCSIVPLAEQVVVIGREVKDIQDAAFVMLKFDLWNRSPRGLCHVEVRFMKSLFEGVNYMAGAVPLPSFQIGKPVIRTRCLFRSERNGWKNILARMSSFNSVGRKFSVNLLVSEFAEQANNIGGGPFCDPMSCDGRCPKNVFCSSSAEVFSENRKGGLPKDF